MKDLVGSLCSGLLGLFIGRFGMSECPRNEPLFTSDVPIEAPSTESEAPGIRRGLEWEAIEEVRSLRVDRKAEDGSDMLDKGYFQPPAEDYSTSILEGPGDDELAARQSLQGGRELR